MDNLDKSQTPDSFQLAVELQQALRAKNKIRIEQLTQQLAVIEQGRWLAITNTQPELIPFQSIAEAVLEIARESNLPFPNLTLPPHHTDHMGCWRFAACDDQREIRLYASAGNPQWSYDVCLFDYSFPTAEDGVIYRGYAPTLSEAVLAMRYWYIDYWEIEVIHNQYLWLPNHPEELLFWL